MNSRKEEFKKTICKIVGHNEKKNKCVRCGKKFPSPFVMYELIGMVIYNSQSITKVAFTE